MITEDYVSFETAKLLKENGFDEECSRFYMPNGYVVWKYDHYHNFDIRERIECPTLQMAMKWLREVHNLHIIVFRYDNSAFPYIWYIFAHNGDKPHIADSYEQACEAAIKYCLEHLI